MEPDVIRMYSSSPPPLEDGEEEDDFGDFDGFSSVPHSVSLTEFDTPTTFNQVQALNATSPPELLNNGRVAGHPGTAAPHTQEGDPAKANGVLSGGRHSSCPSERTVGETKKALSCVQLPVDCNGEGPEVLTNGFKMLDVQGIPLLQNSVNSCRTGASPEDTEAVPPESRDDEFADFAAFADVGASDSPPAHTADVSQSPFGGCSLREGPSPVYSNIDQGITLEGDMEEAHRVGLDGSESVSSCELPDVPSSQQQGGLSDTKSKQPDCLPEHLNTVCTTTEMLALNGFCDDRAEETAGSGEDCTPQERTGKEETTERSVEEATGNGTETRTSLDQDPPELCGDPSTTGLGPSALPQEDSAAPNHHSPPPEDQDVGFRGFDGGDGFSDQGFAHFDQLDVQEEHGLPSTQSTADQQVPGDQEDEDFGDFNTQRFEPAGTEEEQEEGEEPLPLEDSNYNSNDDKDRGQLTEFPGSDSFGNFSSVDVAPQAGAGWSAFSEEAGPADEDSWAAFDGEQGSTPPEVQEEWSTAEAPPPTSDHPNSRTEVHSVALSGRVERLFQQSFPGNPVTEVEEKVPPLKCLLEPTEEPGGAPQGPGKGPRTTPPNGALRANVWRQLLDIHEAFGLRHQWGGSHSNKTLLCSLGIDTRNILFTGQKKQAIIVPMYAASLGMLEPTKEPVKPTSAAEMITSIAQAPPLGTEKSPCPDTAQHEALPPVQFDWSSSGLTNPLDGVDPELYELTTAKLDSTGSGRRVVDAFARLMSTMEKTSTSARKPKKEEHLSAEAAKVMASLPDLSFMQAKVLMFPTTLTPLGCSRATPD